MISQRRTDTITIDTSKMANESNNYNTELPHQYNTEVIIKSINGFENKISMGHLLSMAAMFIVMKETKDQPPGKVLDRFYNALMLECDQEAVSKAIGLFNK